eukprot:15366275-Ditylum_brightwellii.AAC.1
MSDINTSDCTMTSSRRRRPSSTRQPSPQRKREKITKKGDTLKELGVAFKDIAKKNTDLLKNIEARKSKKVIYQYALKHCISPGQNDEALLRDLRGETISLYSKKKTDTVDNLLSKWRYSGKSLEEPEEDVFNDNIDYTLDSYADVMRLNSILLEVGSKICTRLAENDSSRRDLRIFILNMEHLYVVIQELHELTYSKSDPFENNSELNECIQGVANSVAEHFSFICSQFPTAKLVLSVNDAAKVYQKKKMMLQNTLHGHEYTVRALEMFVWDGKRYLASASDDKSIKVWDLEGQKMISSLEGHHNSVTSFAVFSCDGKTILVSGSHDRTIKLWDLNTQSLLVTMENAFAINAFAKVKYQGNMTLASGDSDGSIKFWDIKKQKFLDTANDTVGDPVISLAAFNLEKDQYLA